jgi:hypothetical protein
VVDRDRWPWSGPDGHDWGLSVGADGSVAFGADDAVEAHTVCTAGVDVLDGRWHHVAAQRRSTVLELWVDGSRVASGTAPAGDLRYPDGAPGARDTDPYLVLGAEKHDAGSAYPSFSGSIDELRLSPVARYSVDFAVPAGPFVLDGSTAALYHFDEGSGSTAAASPTATAVAVLRRSASGAPVWMHH